MACSVVFHVHQAKHCTVLHSICRSYKQLLRIAHSSCENTDAQAVQEPGSNNDGPSAQDVQVAVQDDEQDIVSDLLCL